MSAHPPDELTEIALRDLLDLLERQAGDILHVEAVENRRFDELRQFVVRMATASDEVIRTKVPNLLPRLERLLQTLSEH